MPAVEPEPDFLTSADEMDRKKQEVERERSEHLVTERGLRRRPRRFVDPDYSYY